MGVSASYMCMRHIPKTNLNSKGRQNIRSVASVALGLWFLAVKTCLTLALEAIHAVLVGRNSSEKMLSPSSFENGAHRNQSISHSRRRVRIRRSSGESAASSRTGSEGEDEIKGGCSVNGADNTVYHSKTIKLRYRSSLKKRKEQVQYSPQSMKCSTNFMGQIS